MREKQISVHGKCSLSLLALAKVLVICAGICILGAVDAFGWGEQGHKFIARQACHFAHPDMRKFFMANVEYISEHSIDPDIWKHEDKEEGPRHFIDLEAYGNYPFIALPRDKKKAFKKFGEEIVKSTGTLPWRIEEYTRKLSKSMKAGDWGKVADDASHLSHYVADASQPLHTAVNYNGRLTGNDGIHFRYEIDLINKYLDFYSNIATEFKEAQRIDDVLSFAFKIILESNRKVDDVLRADRAALEVVLGDRARVDSTIYFALEDKKENESTRDRYFSKLQYELGYFTRGRMKRASEALASLWYTAWLNAGEPAPPSEKVK